MIRTPSTSRSFARSWVRIDGCVQRAHALRTQACILLHLCFENTKKAHMQELLHVHVQARRLTGTYAARCFLRTVTRMNDIDDPIVLEEAFKMFDKDGNGQISRAELRLAFQNILQTTEEDLPLTEMEDMLREFDRNGDGSINFAEFKQYMMED